MKGFRKLGEPLFSLGIPARLGLGDRHVAGGDTTAPTVVITSAITSPSLEQVVAVTITFSEAVSNFVVGDITISAGGSLASFATADNIVFTASWTLAAGANTMDIASGVCTDTAGNNNVAATQFPMTYGITVPAITPTLGSELVVNPGFEGVFEDESGGGGGTVNVAPNWNIEAVETDGTDTLNESATAHGGSKSQSVVVNAADEGVRTPTNILPQAGWYTLSAWLNITSGIVALLDTGGDIYFFTSTTGSWINAVTTQRATSARAFIIRSRGGGANFLVDDASAKAITFSTMRSLVGTKAALDGTYTCTPTVADGTQAGFLIGYADDNNYVMAVVDRGSNSSADLAKIYKCISGTFSLVTSGNITYSAGAQLKVVASGGSFSLYYNGTQEGTTQAIATGTLGLQVHGFNSYAGNTVGVVATQANP